MTKRSHSKKPRKPARTGTKRSYKATNIEAKANTKAYRRAYYEKYFKRN